jgi:hypothetical protein
MNYVIEKTKRKIKLSKKDTSGKNTVSIKNIHEEKSRYFENLQKKVLPDLLKKKGCDEKIRKIIEREEELDYYFKTAGILSEYFEIENSGAATLDQSVCSRRTELIKQYFTVLEMTIPQELYLSDLYVDTEVCPQCPDETVVVDTGDEGLICTECGLVLFNKNITDTLSYKERQTVDYITSQDYKRVDYFKQWLSQIQAKEQTKIPVEIVDTVIVELKAERLLNTSKVNVSVVKRILKKTNNAKYYDNAPYIVNAINDVPVLRIPEYIEQKMIAMFEEIQEPWESLKNKDRKNFFSYPYTIRKFCEILGLDECGKNFQYLKSREKLYKQDVVWKKIIEYLLQFPPKREILRDVEWRYIPSL